MKLERITGEVRKELRKAFTQVRRDLSPLMDHLRFGDITPLWWIKNRKKDRFMGRCYKGIIKFPGVRGWKRNPIILSKNYFNTNGIEDFVGVWKHELVHLVAKDSHGSSFMSLAVCCGAKRHCPSNK